MVTSEPMNNDQISQVTHNLVAILLVLIYSKNTKNKFIYRYILTSCGN